MNEHIRLIFSAVIICFTVSLSGCLIKKHRPEIDLVEGTLRSPEGVFRIYTYKNADTEDSRYSLYSQDNRPELFLYGNDEKTFITMGVLPQYDGIGILSLGDQRQVAKITKANYMLNGQSSAFDLRFSTGDFDRYRKPDSKYFKYRMIISLPENLALLDTSSYGGSLRPVIIKRIRAAQGDIHQFTINFTLGDDPYEIDVSFRVKLGTRWTIGVPATP